MQLLKLTKVKYGKRDPYPWFIAEVLPNIFIRYATAIRKVRFCRYTLESSPYTIETFIPIGSSVHKILNAGISK